MSKNRLGRRERQELRNRRMRLTSVKGSPLRDVSLVSAGCKISQALAREDLSMLESHGAFVFVAKQRTVERVGRIERQGNRRIFKPKVMSVPR